MSFFWRDSCVTLWSELEMLSLKFTGSSSATAAHTSDEQACVVWLWFVSAFILLQRFHVTQCSRYWEVNVNLYFLITINVMEQFLGVKKINPVFLFSYLFWGVCWDTYIVHVCVWLHNEPLRSGLKDNRRYKLAFSFYVISTTAAAAVLIKLCTNWPAPKVMGPHQWWY